MFSHQNFSYELHSIWNNESLLQKQDSMKWMAMDKDSISRAKNQKIEVAAKKHAKAEQLRRKRINTHIQTLKKLLLPNMTSKMILKGRIDNMQKVKASILTETIRQLMKLRKRAADVALQQYGQADVSGNFTFPDGSDEATVSRCEGGEGKTVKATICCEDRPGLNQDLTEAIRSAGGKPVRAEIATVGGRTKAVVVVRWAEGGGEEEEEVGLLTRALKALMESGPLGSIMRVNGGTGLGLEISRN